MQRLLSSQLVPLPALHFPPLHLSSAVHLSPSSQLLVLLVWPQPEVDLQVKNPLPAHAPPLQNAGLQLWVTPSQMLPAPQSCSRLADGPGGRQT